ncbi:hypothetical protein ACHAPD_006473 [Fusarium lateritium]
MTTRGTALLGELLARRTSRRSAASAPDTPLTLEQGHLSLGLDAKVLDGDRVYDQKFPQGQESYVRARWVVRGIKLANDTDILLTGASYFLNGNNYYRAAKAINVRLSRAVSASKAQSRQTHILLTTLQQTTTIFTGVTLVGLDWISYVELSIKRLLILCWLQMPAQMTISNVGMPYKHDCSILSQTKDNSLLYQR